MPPYKHKRKIEIDGSSRNGAYASPVGAILSKVTRRDLPKLWAMHNTCRHSLLEYGDGGHSSAMPTDNIIHKVQLTYNFNT